VSDHTLKTQGYEGILDLADADLAATLRSPEFSQRHWYVILNSYTARILSFDSVTSVWRDVGLGDVGDETAELLKSAAKASRLKWTRVQEPNLLAVRPDSATANRARVQDINSWLKGRDAVTGMGRRQPEINERVRFEVASQAAWHCQFHGCGEDLREHFVPGSTGNYGYFAHIVASSSNGPRGDVELSPKLAQDPSNIMLLCDRCHRLIDRIAPWRYGRSILGEMRRNNIAEVRRCLGALRFPAAQMLVVGGNIEGQNFAFDERVAEEAMLLRRLRNSGSRPEWFARHGSHLGNVHSDAYWLSLFELLRSTDIPRLRALLAGTSKESLVNCSLAVFPVHSTSVLVLTGRLIGESRSVHVFQFHRDQVTGKPGGPWAWPGIAPQPQKYRVQIHKEANEGSQEALLQVHLTARIPRHELPAGFSGTDGWLLPTVEVTCEECTHRVVGDPEDLELFGRALDDAFRLLQDEWRVRTIHLLVVAPVSACVRIGQKMQARFHADFVLYERTRDFVEHRPAPFTATIRISPSEVTLVSAGESISLT
jgi:5-methylcytosine-specific restriction endonuclease McrA